MGKTQKSTVGCRVTADELLRIDAIAQELGQSRGEWLYGLIYRELTGTERTTVRGLCDRVAALERKLARLAQ